MDIEIYTNYNKLYDYYGNLLTKKQRDVFELHYIEDMSVTEISEELNISRQAVHAHIQRSEDILLNLEKKLCFSTIISKYEAEIDNLQMLLSKNNINK